jgi:hypothetical protein
MVYLGGSKDQSLEKPTPLDANDPRLRGSAPEPVAAPGEPINEKLYKLSGMIADVYALLEENGGELDEELEEALGVAEPLFRDKLERTAMMVLNFEQDASVIEARALSFQETADRLKAKAKARRAAADRLKSYIMRCMEEAQETKVQLPYFDVRVQSNSTPSVEPLVDLQHLPSEFTILPEPKLQLNRAAVIAAWKQDPVRVHDSDISVHVGHHLRIV